LISEKNCYWRIYLQFSRAFSITSTYRKWLLQTAYTWLNDIQTWNCCFKNQKLKMSIRKVLENSYKKSYWTHHNATFNHDKDDRVYSLFLLRTGISWEIYNESNFLQEVAEKMLAYMKYQNPSYPSLFVAQPGKGKMDEQWFALLKLFVNTMVYSCRRLLNRRNKAYYLDREMCRFYYAETIHLHVKEELVVKHM